MLVANKMENELLSIGFTGVSLTDLSEPEVELAVEPTEQPDGNERYLFK